MWLFLGVCWPVGLCGSPETSLGGWVLAGWLAVGPKTPLRNVKIKPYVLIVEDFDVPDHIWDSIRDAAGDRSLLCASVTLLD